MKRIILFSFIILLIMGCGLLGNKNQNKGSFHTGVYPNLFVELLGLTKEEVKLKIDNAFNQLFYGDDKNERVFYPVGNDMAYIVDINNDDVRTEGMSYGMMITVQLDKKEEFDRLWKWAKTNMQHQSGPRKDFFAWHCRTDGTKISENSASDGEEWFVMALFFASARWKDGVGIFNYKQEAQKILDAMLNKVEYSNEQNVVTNMFNKKQKQIVFVPSGDADDFTDPSYHLPHFYQLWAKWADKENNFWSEVADTSRNFLKRAVHPETGLSPDYANFDGTPIDRWGGGHNNFQYDAWRVAMNVAVDYQWFAKDKWAVEQSNRLLNFFYSKGIKDYGSLFTLDGEKLFPDHSEGLVAMNTVAALASDLDFRSQFVRELWELKMPTGRYRYYNGLLTMLGLLQVSGNFRIYEPNK